MNLAYTPKDAYNPNDPYWFLRQREAGDAEAKPSASSQATEKPAVNWENVAKMAGSAEEKKGSAAGNIIGSTLGGAATGSSVLPGWGTAIGGVVGLGKGIVQAIAGNQSATRAEGEKQMAENNTRLEDERSAARDQVAQNEQSATSKLANLAKMRADAADRYRFRSFRNLALQGGV